MLYHRYTQHMVARHRYIFLFLRYPIAGLSRSEIYIVYLVVQD